MNCLPQSYETVAENLACDELLLDDVERSGTAWLRFWRTNSPAVVVGYANKVAAEVNVDFCRSNNVEVHRRLSGGGTVALTPGCLCYSLVLPIVQQTPFEQVSQTNRFIMETNRSAIETAVNRSITIQGVTDLAVDGKKFSGNSQKRGRRALLFHGTILLDANLEFISNCLNHPSSEPEWRAGRPHKQFITNLPVSEGEILRALGQAWPSEAGELPFSIGQLTRLATNRYKSDQWTFAR